MSGDRLFIFNHGIWAFLVHILSANDILLIQSHFKKSVIIQSVLFHTFWTIRVHSRLSSPLPEANFI